MNAALLAFAIAGALCVCCVVATLCVCCVMRVRSAAAADGNPALAALAKMFDGASCPKCDAPEKAVTDE